MSVCQIVRQREDSKQQGGAKCHRYLPPGEHMSLFFVFFLYFSFDICFQGYIFQEIDISVYTP